MQVLMGCVLLLTAFIAGPVHAQKINFDEGWKFHLGHAADATKDFNYSIANIFAKSGKAEKTAIEVSFNDSAWEDIQVPHDWAVKLPFENSPNFDVMAHGYKPVGGFWPQNSIGWYRKHFTIAKSDSSKRFSIQFDGVFRDSKIWINGFYVGNNESGYIGQSYDITDYIQFDKDNVVVVRVDASQYEGWFYEGAGIYRHVWLVQKLPTHIIENGLFVYADVKGTEAMVHIETTISNKNFEPREVEIRAHVADRNGKVLILSDPIKTTLNPGEQKTVAHTMALTGIQRWTLTNPYLYKVGTTIRDEQGNLLDNERIRFGLREVSINAKTGFSLNGESIKLKGVNCHQDHAGIGSALPDYLQYYRVRLLKEMGVNAYRASHNAPTPELLDACDSLGMLMLDETRLSNSSPEYIDQFERLLLRDRSRTCVFLWSIGNEEQTIQTTSIGKRIAQTLLFKQQQLDPTRLSTYAADLGNVFSGINEVVPVRGFNYRHAFIDAYHADHPTQPIVGTEMGSTVTTRGIYVVDSVKAYVPDQDITYPWWASSAEQWWAEAAEKPWYMGGFIWTGFDYRGEPTPFQWPNINSHFGVMDMCGFPKNIYYYYQSWWSDKDVLHISPHWNWKGREGEMIDVWVNSNASEVELILNGKSLGKKTMKVNSHLRWAVPYKQGVLEAIGYKEGRKFRTRVETTDVPHHIELISDRKIILADGKDATVINVLVKDKKGREVPNANNLIHFSLKGNAKIIGVGNGDPSCHEPDQYADGVYKRSAFNGRCQLIIQAGKQEGPVVVTASGTRLLDGNVQIQLSKSVNN